MNLHFFFYKKNTFIISIINKKQNKNKESLYRAKASVSVQRVYIRHFFLLHFPPFTERLTSHAWERWRGNCDESVTSSMPSSHNSEKMAASGHFNCPLMPCWNVTGREEARTQLAGRTPTDTTLLHLSLHHTAQDLMTTHLNMNTRPSLSSLHNPKSRNHMESHQKMRERTRLQNLGRARSPACLSCLAPWRVTLDLLYEFFLS